MNEWLAMLIPALATALLHFVWQGALVALLAWSALSLLRNARPQVRYAIACAALFACALLPFWNVWQALPDAPDLWRAAGGFGAMDTGGVAGLLPGAGGAVQKADWSLPDAASPWIVALWASGALLLSLRMACGAWWTQWLRRDARPESGRWQACVDRFAPLFLISRPVSVRLLDTGDTPMTIGVWRPVVLLPAAIVARMPAELLEALVAHELAHIRRHDYLVNLLQGAVEALLFYHPAVWWLSRRIRIERELVADDLAARVTGQPRQLAVALSELDRLASAAPAFPPTHHALAAHGGHLMSRIRQLLKPERRALGITALLPLIGVAAIGTAFYAHARLADAPMSTANTSVTRIVQPAALAATTAAPSHALAMASRAGGADGPSYAFVRKGEDGFRMSGDLDDVDGIRAAQRAIDGDFIWFRRDGKAWVIRDQDTLARALAASRRVDPLDAEMRALDRQMRPHDERMQALGKQMEQLSAGIDGESPDMRAAAKRMEALARKMEALAREQMALVGPVAQASGDSERQQALQARMDALQVRQEAVQRDMEREQAVMETAAAHLEARQQPMEALGREMEAAAKPMEDIGRDMEQVGKRLEREAGIADAEIRRLIDDAYARGLAMSAPTTH